MIDFYNEFPYNVNVIEMMNKELSNLQDEYNILDNKYNQIKNKDENTIWFQSIEERNKKNTEMLSNIKVKCDEIIDGLPDSFLYDYGFGSLFHRGIFEFIRSELTKLTDNQEWVYSISYKIISGLLFFKGREMPHWRKIFNSLTVDELKEILFDHIEDSINEFVYTCYRFPGYDDY